MVEASNVPPRFVDAGGYVRVRVAANDWRYEHRAVWEQVNGPIPDGHHIHHLNHVRSDNRLENLVLVKGVEHNRHHTTARHRSGELNNRGSNSVRWRGEIDDAEIVRRHDAGESFRSIGRDMGVAHNVIANHYRRHLEAGLDGSTDAAADKHVDPVGVTHGDTLDPWR